MADIIDISPSKRVELTPVAVLEAALEDAREEDWKTVFIIVDTGENMHYRSNVASKPAINWLLDLVKNNLVTDVI